jgi:hypothetical protein
MIYSAFEMGECTGNEMEVEEIPLLEFPRQLRQITVILGVMVPRLRSAFS